MDAQSIINKSAVFTAVSKLQELELTVAKNDDGGNNDNDDNNKIFKLEQWSNRPREKESFLEVNTAQHNALVWKFKRMGLI